MHQLEDQSPSVTDSASAKGTSNHLPLYVSAAVIVLLVGCYFLWPAFQSAVREAFDILTSGDRPRIAKWVQQFGAWGPVWLILAFIIQMFLVVINVVLLILVAILAYGRWWGSLWAFVGIVVASSVGYGLGHLLGEGFVGRLLGEKSQKKVVDQVQRYGVWAVVIARISPIISNDAVSFVAGLARMGYLKFLIATAGASCRSSRCWRIWVRTATGSKAAYCGCQG
ncbi:TVP38/TMEM64 family protein [Hymenobacter sp. HDW8]|uniref:TVP38/TMEM64 family protein n=1 Tax=Hymenobacter sp. HDW8 TaxID=2714932 RepID=UPI001F10FE74|nr:VTT domain-containing protein [Hymenobacter sp. HDW8]